MLLAPRSLSLTFLPATGILKQLEPGTCFPLIASQEDAGMTTTISISPAIETLADLHERLGGVPLHRIRFHPAPGTATESDVLLRPNGEKRLFELVDGVLVEKPMGYYESLLAALLIGFLRSFLEQNDLGIVLGADATLRLAPGRVRLPDVSFISWDRFPNRVLPAQPIPDLAPHLAVEVLSEGNTEAEMERKLREYFAAGVRLVWYVEPETRIVRVYTDPTEVRILREDDTLDGGAVLPGFHLPIRDWFRRAGSRAPRP
jgi:Uma2 family endonuclease